MHWQTVWAWLRTWQGAVPAAFAALAAVYYGPKKMLETWDWYWDRFRDNEVFLVVERRLISHPPRSNYVVPRMAPMEFAYTVKEIAERLGRKESSVLASLKRLRRRGKIEQYHEGWRLKRL
jgi:hypothetical protein